MPASYEFLLDEHHHGVWERELFERFVDRLRHHGFHVTVRSERHFVAQARRGSPFAGRHEIELSHNLAILRHCRSRRYWAIDGNDWSLPFTNQTQIFTHDRRCRAVLKCQWSRRDFTSEQLEKVHAWSYFETHCGSFRDQLDALRCHRQEALQSSGGQRPLFFRGNTSWCERAPVLDALASLGVLAVDPTQSLVYDRYLRELAGYRLALGLPGFGNLCHREIEAFGIGVPVLMPTHRNQTHEPLVPDVHYFGVDTDPEREPADRVASLLAARYREVINDDDRLDTISQNARAWYEGNVRQPASLDLGLSILGLLPRR